MTYITIIVLLATGFYVLASYYFASQRRKTLIERRKLQGGDRW